MKIKDFLNIAHFILGPPVRKHSDKPTGYPLMMKGHTGIGKSEIAKLLADSYQLPIVERRVSQMTEGDLIGLPELNEGVTSWCPPDFYMKACETPVILFLDELDRGVPEVRQGCFELADSRKLNGHTLHPGTKIICAINGGLADSSSYQVYTMDRAELARWWSVEIKPSVDDWLSWASESTKDNSTKKQIQDSLKELTISYRKNQIETNVHFFFYDFIAQNPEFLEHNGPTEPNKIYPTRRSWKRLSDTMTKAGLLLSKENIDYGTLQSLSQGFVGLEASLALQKFYIDYDFLLDPEDMIAGEGKDRIKRFNINDHSLFIKKFDNKKILTKELTSDEIFHLVDYVACLPQELLLSFFTLMGTKDIAQQNIIHLFTHYMPKWSEAGKKNYSVGEYYAECVEESELELTKT